MSKMKKIIAILLAVLFLVTVTAGAASVSKEYKTSDPIKEKVKIPVKLQ